MAKAMHGTTADAKTEPVHLGTEIKHRLPALKALTSLRFFAAIYVVVYHLSTGHTYTNVSLVGSFIGSGYTGVSLFFVLSGFILAYNYREVRNRREFWISRFARIYPVYMVALLLGFAYSFAPASSDSALRWLRLGFCAALVQTWYIPFANSFNGPGWTLTAEAFFYALFPFLLSWLRRFGDGALVVFCGLYLAALSIPLAAHFAQPSGRVGFASAYYLTWGTLPPVHLPMFVIGVYLGMKYLKSPEHRSRWPLVLGAAGSVVLLCLSPADLYTPIRKGLLVMSYAALIYGLAPVRRGWLTSRWMVLAGEISFSIYILQMPVIRTVLGVTRRLGMGFYPSSTAVLIVLIGVSFLAYRFIELPARVAIRSRLTHKPISLTQI